MNVLDYIVLLATILGIAGYGAWHTRHRGDMAAYWKGVGKMRWTVIGVSVMATQASAITFLSTPGQGYDGGLGFVQNYFGLPLALIIVAAIFLLASSTGNLARSGPIDFQGSSWIWYPFGSGVTKRRLVPFGE